MVTLAQMETSKKVVYTFLAVFVVQVMTTIVTLIVNPGVGEGLITFFKDVMWKLYAMEFSGYKAKAVYENNKKYNKKDSTKTTIPQGEDPVG